MNRFQLSDASFPIVKQGLFQPELRIMLNAFFQTNLSSKRDLKETQGGQVRSNLWTFPSVLRPCSEAHQTEALLCNSLHNLGFCNITPSNRKGNSASTLHTHVWYMYKRAPVSESVLYGSYTWPNIFPTYSCRIVMHSAHTAIVQSCNQALSSLPFIRHLDGS